MASNPKERSLEESSVGSSNPWTKAHIPLQRLAASHEKSDLSNYLTQPSLLTYLPVAHLNQPVNNSLNYESRDKHGRSRIFSDAKNYKCTACDESLHANLGWLLNLSTNHENMNSKQKEIKQFTDPTIVQLILVLSYSDQTLFQVPTTF